MISVENLSIEVGQFSLQGVHINIETGQYGVLMGKTGCGKTTILEAICGLKKISSGMIRLMGQDVTRLKAALRGIGFVPQDGAVFNNMTVRENLSFSVVIRKWAKKAIEERVNELSELLGLENLLERMPYNLSGGEKQRVALGRALASRPNILCMDEPLSALDEETRGEMYELLKLVQIHTGVTALHITHSHSEAFKLADIVFLIKDGTVQKISPSELSI